MSHNNPYNVLATYYDRLMSGYDYDSIFNYLDKHIGTKGIDLACGSGKMTTKIAISGRSIIGIDQSPTMINVAMENSRASGVIVPYICENILDVELTKCDFVLCCCDVINYIPPANLETLFRKINKALTPNGTFVFDFSTTHKLVEVIGNNLFYEDTEELTYLWENSLNEDYVDMSLLFFVKEGTEYKRYDENHTLYIYRKDDIVALLNKSGYDIIEVLDCDSLKVPNLKSQRILFRVGVKNG